MKLSILLAVFFLFLSASAFGVKPFIPTESLVIDGKNWKISQAENMSMRTADDRQVLRLDESTESPSVGVDLFLDFESRNLSLPNYSVLNSKFELNRYQSVNGRTSAKFYLPEHSISLMPRSTSLFAPGNNPGSFTLEFWLYFYKNYDNQVVISYAGNDLSDENDTNYYGFAVQTKNNRIQYRFDNFFKLGKSDAVSFSMEESDPIRPYRWEHHAITFNVMNGRLTVYKNGIEDQSRWVTLNEDDKSPILSPLVKQELSTPVVIGMNGCFAIDNLKIIRDARNNFYLKKFNDKDSKVVTEVYKISDNITTIKKISFDFERPDQSFLKLAYRISPKYFLADDRDIPWVYMQNNLEYFPADHQDGKYIQFKIAAYPNQDQDSEIVVRSIKVDHNVDSSPYPPTITAIQPLDEQAMISWVPTPEDDIQGYEIYYGNSTGNYISADAREGKSPIFVPAERVGKILPMTNTLTGLVNERPYYISIRSVDKKGHRSPYAREMYVRPSTVYNSPLGYSVGR
jgi:hypothetical protein